MTILDMYQGAAREGVKFGRLCKSLEELRRSVAKTKSYFDRLEIAYTEPVFTLLDEGMFYEMTCLGRKN